MEALLEPYRIAIDEAVAALRQRESGLGEVAFEYVVAGGKRLRPTITLLTCEALAGTYKKALPIALVYEFAHTASLTQDDIIDNSPTRHNRPGAHTKHGVKTAILISDMLIFEIFDKLGESGELLTKEQVTSLIRYVATAAKKTAEGEFLEMELSKETDLTVKDYIRLAGLKTGALFAAAASSGGVVAGAKPRVVTELYEFGTNFGIAFQTVDDILDFTGSSKTMGKPRLKDLQNNPTNIVIVHALSQADGPTKNRIRSMMLRSAQGFVDVVELLALLDDLGSVEFASKLAEKHAIIARSKLRLLPDNAPKQTLKALTRWLEAP